METHGALALIRQRPTRPSLNVEPPVGRFALKRGDQGPAASRVTQAGAQPEPDRGRVLCCGFCGRPVTTTAARIEVGGAHAHTFANPEGIAFRVGCFSDAAGLRGVGPESTYWTWFPGHSWQVELCARCGEQLGWRYRSRGSDFHGLILDRLVEQAE